MHELGIIVQISKTLEDVAQENHLEKIGSVTLEIGEVSGIVSDYFDDCWKFYCKKTPLLEGAKLHVIAISAITHCTHCQKDYETVRYGKICPHCQSDQTYLIQGNEINIKEIEAYGASC